MDGELLTIGYIGIWREMTTLKRVVKWMKKYRKFTEVDVECKEPSYISERSKKKKRKKKNRNTLL